MFSVVRIKTGGNKTPLTQSNPSMWWVFLLFLHTIESSVRNDFSNFARLIIGWNKVDKANPFNITVLLLSWGGVYIGRLQKETE